MTVKETIAIAALFKAICAKLYKLRSQNLNLIIYPKSLVMENKFRASRYGIDGLMIDFGKEIEVNTRGLLLELLDFVDDVVDHLGSRFAINWVHEMLGTGTGADRQLAVYEATNEDLVKVTEYIESSFLSL